MQKSNMRSFISRSFWHVPIQLMKRNLKLASHAWACKSTEGCANVSAICKWQSFTTIVSTRRKVKGSLKSLRFMLRGNRNVCATFHSQPSNSCWDNETITIRYWLASEPPAANNICSASSLFCFLCFAQSGVFNSSDPWPSYCRLFVTSISELTLHRYYSHTFPTFFVYDPLKWSSFRRWPLVTDCTCLSEFIFSDCPFSEVKHPKFNKKSTFWYN